MIYSLFNLIMFFRQQSFLEYSAINKVLEIIDSESIPEMDKKELILGTLNQAGLYEESEEDLFEQIENMSKKKDTPKKVEPMGDDIIIPIETFKVQILNATARVIISLN